jgi:cytochrome c
MIARCLHEEGSRSRPSRWIALVAIFGALALSACGSADDDNAQDTNTIEISGAAPSPPAVEAPAVADVPPVVAEELAPAAAPDAAGPPAVDVAEPVPADPIAPPVAEAEAVGPGPVAVAAADAPPAGAAGAVVEPARTEAFAPDLLTDEDVVLARVAAADANLGWSYAQRCVGCHSISLERQGVAAPQIGPSLVDVAGAVIGAVPGFDYSAAFVALRDAEMTWTAARLDAFLADPAAVVPGTAMTSGAIADAQARADLIAFLTQLADRTGIAGLGTTDIAAQIDQANSALGETFATARCGGCHRFGENDEPFVGPNLFNVVGRVVGGDPQFSYSPALEALNRDGEIWSLESLDAFLRSPSVAIPGTRMGFTGIPGASDRANVIAFLRSLSVAGEAPAAGIGVFQPGLSPVTFTAQQVELGRRYYAAYQCELCHGDDLRGRVDIGGLGDAPTLTGTNFQRRWFSGSVFALLDYITRRKNLPVAVDEEEAAAIIAYILSRSGFSAGEAALSTDETVLMDTGFFQQPF